MSTFTVDLSRHPITLETVLKTERDNPTPWMFFSFCASTWGTFHLFCGPFATFGLFALFVQISDKSWSVHLAAAAAHVTIGAYSAVVVLFDITSTTPYTMVWDTAQSILVFSSLIDGIFALSHRAHRWLGESLVARNGASSLYESACSGRLFSISIGCCSLHTWCSYIRRCVPGFVLLFCFVPFLYSDTVLAFSDYYRDAPIHPFFSLANSTSSILNDMYIDYFQRADLHTKLLSVLLALQLS